jgi:D-lactate dehydrogenase
MKIVYVAKESWEHDYVAEKLPGIEFVPEGDAGAEVLCVFVDHTVDAAEIGRYPQLKLIATRSTGFDHIDLSEARQRGVAVATVPSYGVNTVAEFAFALILALSRRVCEAAARVRGGSFSQDGLEGFDLAGKTLGVVGCGRIGQHSVKIGMGFGMNVLVYDPIHNDELQKELGFQYVDLPDLLAQSDVITLHIPYSEATHHLINKESIKAIKKGALLINTARGAVVETVALVEALESGGLGGAGLDVLEEEGDMGHEERLLAGAHQKEEELRVVLENHALAHHPRVIITPHVAFDTAEALRRILDTTVENIAAFAAGTPKNLLS